MPKNLVYPDLYYQVYPKVIDVVSKHIDNISEKGSISDEYLEKMIDEVYTSIVALYPEIHEDPIERRGRFSRNRAAQRPYYGRRALLRDFISVILISELLRRSRPYGYWDYPGYYYSPWY